MSSQQEKEAHEAVLSFTRRPNTQRPKPDCVLHSFGDALNHVRGLPCAAGWPPMELEVAVAMSLLGPQGSGPPPTHQRAEIVRLLSQAARSPAAQMQRLDEIVIAYGCGWKRSQPCSAQPGLTWDHLWANAVVCLSRRFVLPAVQKVDKWLAQLDSTALRGYPDRTLEELESDADALTLMFISPTKSFECRPEEAGRIQATTEQGATVRLATTHRGINLRSVLPSAHFVFQTDQPICLCLAVSKGWRMPAASEARVELLARDDDAQVSLRRPASNTIAAGETATGDKSKKRKKPGRTYNTIAAGQTATVSGPATLHVWECTCAWKWCHERHRLANWDHTQSRRGLGVYTGNAICGPHKPPLPKSAINGMYLPFLIKEGTPRLRIVNVEFKICSDCQSMYAQQKCPNHRCQAAFNEERMRTCIQGRLIVAGLPHAERGARYRCSNRADHYRRINDLSADAPVPPEILKDDSWDNFCAPPPDRSDAQPCCPLCKQHVGGRRSSVWQLDFPGVYNLADPNHFDLLDLASEDSAEADDEDNLNGPDDEEN